MLHKLRLALHTVKDHYTKLSAYAKFCIALGAYLMLCFYIVSLAAWLYAPYALNYFRALAVVSGCLEAAPASLAAGTCAGLICDMVLASRKKNQ